MTEWTSAPVFLTDTELVREWREQTRNEGDPRSDELRSEIEQRKMDYTRRRSQRARKGSPFVF